MKQRPRAITLLELLLSLILLGVVVIGLNSIYSFSHSHIFITGKRAKLQNEVSMLLDHVSKNAARATGNEIVSGANSVVREQTNAPNNNNDRVSFNTDTDGNGVSDSWIGYRWQSASKVVQYCGDCADLSDCSSCGDPWADVAENIRGFYVTKPTNGLNMMNDNTITIVVEACADQTTACGTMDNPLVNMTVSVSLPKVSVN
jgi:hypothetical protein